MLKTEMGRVAAVRRRARRLSAGGLLAIPLFLAQCEPACEPAPPGPPRVIEERQLGTSLQGRPITAYRLGDPNGKKVLAVGSIHGDEQAGIGIVEYIRDSAAIPAGLDVWVIPTINPDGNAINYETNANGVDLNRNWGPAEYWAPIDCAAVPLNCSGPFEFSEHETQLTKAFLDEIKPTVTVWYHGVGPVVDRAAQPGVYNDAVLTAYAAEVGYGVLTVSCGTGGCTGNVTQYQNATYATPPDVSSAFVVELSTYSYGGISANGLNRHTNAFFAAAAVG